MFLHGFNDQSQERWHLSLDLKGYICAMVKSRVLLGMVVLIFFYRNPYNGYINPYYWVDDHPLLYGNNGSLDPSTYNVSISQSHPSLLLGEGISQKEAKSPLRIKCAKNYDQKQSIRLEVFKYDFGSFSALG